MSGQDLYALYVAACAWQDCMVDAWSDLDAYDQAAWCDMAAQLVLA